MPAPDDVLLRVGRPWLALALGLIPLSVIAFDLTLVVSVVRGLSAQHRLGDIAPLFVLGPVALAGLLMVGWILVRHPVRLWRRITLTSTELRLPQPGWQHLPIGEVAGIGIARIARGVSRGRRWVPVFWRTDGSHVLTGGVGLVTGRPTPDGTSVGHDIAAVAARIEQLQGPLGPLTTQAVQRNPDLSRWDIVDDVWDPAHPSS